VFAGKGLDKGNAFGVRPVTLLEFLAAQNRPFLYRFGELRRPISRAPSSGARSLPASGRVFFGVDINLLSIGPSLVRREAEKHSAVSRHPSKEG
jgi:hypothetical protein